jgi:NAD-dependent deacetylase
MERGMGMTGSPERNDGKIQSIVDVLKKAESLLFITGAGISADSGLPTYRGIGGLYNDNATEEGIPIEMALAGEMLVARPEITWKYLAQIEENCRSATYNRAHAIIAEMEQHFKRVWVLTQNIDGFHADAGSRNLIEIHGNYHHLMCTCCDWRKEVRDYCGLGIPPLGPQCQGPVRPEVVFFGEMLPQDKLQRLYEELLSGFDLYFSIGTTSVFPYIREPMVAAQHLGRPTVEIDPGQTEISDLVDIKLSMGAGKALENIWDAYQKELS